MRGSLIQHSTFCTNCVHIFERLLRKTFSCLSVIHLLLQASLIFRSLKASWETSSSHRDALTWTGDLLTCWPHSICRKDDPPSLFTELISKYVHQPRYCIKGWRQGNEILVFSCEFSPQSAPASCEGYLRWLIIILISDMSASVRFHTDFFQLVFMLQCQFAAGPGGFRSKEEA